MSGIDKNRDMFRYPCSFSNEYKFNEEEIDVENFYSYLLGLFHFIDSCDSWLDNIKDYEAVKLLFIFLEGKRLITLPFSRNVDMPFDKDMEWCSLSAVDVKNKVFGILSKYKLPSDVINELQSIINHCNSLLEGIASLDSKKSYNKLQKHDDFLNMIDNFKRNIFYHIKLLSEKYSIEFKVV